MQFYGTRKQLNTSTKLGTFNKTLIILRNEQFEIEYCSIITKTGESDADKSFK